MDKTEIIDIFALHRRFSVDALEARYNIAHDEMQTVIDELSGKGLLVKDSDTTYKYIEKSKTFRKIFDMLQRVYADTDIGLSDMEYFAWHLEYEIEYGELNCIPNAVLDFWAQLLWCREHGVNTDDFMSDDSINYDEVWAYEVDSDMAKDWDIFEEMIDILEVNERNARILYESFLGFNDYNTFVRLVTEFRDCLTDEELEDIFDAASCFDDVLVDCYRDD